MSGHQYYTVRDKLAFRVVDDELVVYDPISDRTVLLNESATLILELCDGTHNLASVVAAIGDRFPDHVGDLKDDVSRILDELIERGFVRLVARASQDIGK